MRNHETITAVQLEAATNRARELLLQVHHVLEAGHGRSSQSLPPSKKVAPTIEIVDDRKRPSHTERSLSKAERENASQATSYLETLEDSLNKHLPTIKRALPEIARANADHSTDAIGGVEGATVHQSAMKLANEVYYAARNVVLNALLYDKSQAGKTVASANVIGWQDHVFEHWKEVCRAISAFPPFDRQRFESLIERESDRTAKLLQLEELKVTPAGVKGPTKDRGRAKRKSTTTIQRDIDWRTEYLRDRWKSIAAFAQNKGVSRPLMSQALSRAKKRLKLSRKSFGE